LPDRVDEKAIFSQTQRLLAVRGALAVGDVSLARRLFPRLALDADKLALQGNLAERMGDVQGATSAYLAAGDLDGLARMVNRLEVGGDTQAALVLQEKIVWRIEEERWEVDGLAPALLRFGQLYDAFGRKHITKERRVYARRALAAYERAVMLAPLSQMYLLNAGYEALFVGDFLRGQEFFSRAHDIDPKSLDALVGLGRSALIRGDRAQARAYLVAAQRLNAAYPDVRALARDVDHIGKSGAHARI
jgi:tetratricopeptide (TPR) repeat protein